MKDKDFDNLFSDAFSEHESPVPEDMWKRVQTGKDETFNKLFADALQQHESPVPQDMWHRINNPGDAEFDSVFKDTLTNHALPVPAGMWYKVNPQQEKDDNVIAWRRWLMAAVLLLFLGGAAWWYHISDNEQLTMAGKGNSSKNIGVPANKNGQAGKKTGIQGPGNKVNGEKAESAFNSPASMQTQKAISNTGTNLRDVKKQANSLQVRTSDYNNRLKNTPQLPGNIRQNTQNVTDITASNTTSGPLNTGITNQPGEQLNNRQATTSDSPAAIIAQQKQKTNITANIDTTNTAINKATAALKKKEGTSKWSLEILGSGYFAHKQNYDIIQSPPRLIETSGKTPKNNLWGCGAGLRIGRAIGRHVTLKTGLQYIQNRQSVKYREYLSRTSMATPDSLSSLAIVYRDKTLKSRYSSLSIPVLATYETGKKIKAGVTGGVLINVNSSYKGTIPNMFYTDTLKASNVYKKNTGLAVYFGVHVSKNIGNLQVFAEPHVLLSLSSYTKTDVPFKQKVNNYGVNLGIRTDLKSGKKK